MSQRHAPPNLGIWITILTAMGSLNLVGGIVSAVVCYDQGLWFGVAYSIIGTLFLSLLLFAFAATIDAIGVILERQDGG